MNGFTCQACGCENAAGCSKCFVCGTVHDTDSRLDQLTRLVTACGSWAKFRDAMQAGYVPTIWPRSFRKNASRETREFAAAQVELTRLIRERGFRVFDGSKVA